MFLAVEAFRWTKAVLGHPALFRRFAEAKALIQEDETPQVGYLATALAELWCRTAGCRAGASSIGRGT